MSKNSWGRIGGIAVVGIVMIGVLNSCTTAVTFPPPPVVEGIGPPYVFAREARGGGFVTVYARMLPGPLPDTNMAGPPITVARFSNQGEGGKHEKRYDWKPNSQAQYDLVLSNDGSGRTKWTISEIDQATKARTPVRSGHVWACHDYHQPTDRREVGFSDCYRSIRYDPTELSLSPVRNQPASFASYIKGRETGAEETLAPQNGPIWISCTSGCCTLGAFF